MLAVAVAAMTAFAACDTNELPDPENPGQEQEPGQDDGKEPGENPGDDSQLPEVVLAGNSFQYGDEGTPVALNSAIYEAEDGVYTFYFCNQSGITRVADMLKQNPADYMVVSGVTPDADNALTSYTVEQDGLTVTADAPVFDYQTVSVVFNQEEEHVVLNVRFRSKDADAAGSNFYALYDGKCPESDYSVVSNSYAAGREEPTPIVSVIEERNVPAGTYTYYLFDTEVSDGAEPAITITIPESQLNAAYSDEDEFALAEGAAAEFKGIELKGGANAYGGVSVANLSDASLKGVARTIKLTYRSDEDKEAYYRVNYSGSVYATYASSDEAVFGEQKSAAGTLYYYADERTQRTYFVYGNAESKDVADLNRNGEEGAWTVLFSVMTADLADGGTFEASTDGFGMEATAYLYDSYDSVKGEKASATIYRNPNGSGDELYFNYTDSFNGTPFTFEYYGAPVAATVGKDETLSGILAPERPFVSTLRVYDTRNTDDMGWKDNLFTPFTEPKFQRDIVVLQVSKANIRIQGGKVGGTGNCYIFYMQLAMPGKTTPVFDEVDATIYTAVLTIPESAMGKTIDFSEEPDENSYWQFEYNSKYDVSAVNLMWGCGANYRGIPSKGSLRVSQNEDKTFNISLHLYDYIEGLISPGEKKTLVIDVKDQKGILYKGGKSDRNGSNNLLTEADL